MHKSVDFKLAERRELEESWKKHLENQAQKSLLDFKQQNEPGMLLHDQCVQYKRYV